MNTKYLLELNPVWKFYDNLFGWCFDSTVWTLLQLWYAPFTLTGMFSETDQWVSQFTLNGVKGSSICQN